MVWGAIASVALACPERSPSSMSSVRDSAGIRVIENTRIPTRPTASVAAPRLALTIGEASAGDTLYEFARIAGAKRLSDGRVAVLDQRVGRLRYYDSRGRHLLSIGRFGEGPGDFRSPTGLCYLAGDSLLVYNATTQTPVEVFGPRGLYVRSFRASVTPAFFHACNPSGAMLLQIASRPMRLLQARAWSDSARLVLVHRDDSVVVDVGAFPTREMFQTRVDGRPGRAAVPFERRLLAELWDDRVAVSTGHAHELRVYGSNGVLTSIIRWQAPRAAVTPALIREREETVAARLRRSRPDEEGRRDPLNTAAVPYPDSLPAHGALVVSRTGDVWVRRYHPWDAGTRFRGVKSATTWDVFSREGRHLAAVDLPWFLTVLDIGHGYLIGKWVDTLGVQSIRLYEF
jgi:hypothetical protein